MIVAFIADIMASRTTDSPFLPFVAAGAPESYFICEIFKLCTANHAVFRVGVFAALRLPYLSGA